MEVSSVVESILDSFVNGMDIFVRMRAKKQKKPSSNRTHRMRPEDARVHDSLSSRPVEIRAEYTQNVVKHGKRFERGDDRAYSSLAHTLFVLNTGLMNLISNALSSDVMDRSKSRRSLLLLSENAAANTLHALSQLDLRLMAPPQIDPPRYSERKSVTPAVDSTAATPPSRPPPSPLLSRGGWVRSRSGSSVVSAASAKKLTALATENQKTKSVSTRSIIQASKSSIDLSSKRLVTASIEPNSGSCRTSPKLSEKSLKPLKPQKLQLDSERPPSLLLVPADYFSSMEVTSASESYPPPRPPKIPIHARPNPRTRPRPVSGATFLTTSTRIGEIPEHKWPDRPVYEEEQAQLPLPYVIPPPLEPPERKGRGFRLWKRPEKKLVKIA